MAEKKPAKEAALNALDGVKGKAKEAAGAVTGRDDLAYQGKMQQQDTTYMPGAPGPEPPTVAEPTTPREPLPPKVDQGAPELRTGTGTPVEGPPAARGQQAEYLTTAQGGRLYATDHSLKAGERGPTLLQDYHLREKLTHFAHERIPERVVHARGSGAHGVFKANGAAEDICKAHFLQPGVETDVFVRFSPILPSRSGPDVMRDTRGFAIKFYTSQGNFDLLCLNVGVFFVQDGIKFPDLVHAAKPQPDRDIPQAQSAHDTFWDFVGLHTEATHHVMWQLSDRGIPRSYRMMDGYAVNTFRLTSPDGKTSLVKFHLKPRLGVHSVFWEEAQIINGVDPDFHRRDLADAIEKGIFPQWDFGVQVFPDTPEQTFEGIDLLDASKYVPEEIAPVQPVGTLELNRNTTNFFAETEQVAFNPAILVPGIDVTDDPVMQARLFAYLETHVHRLGGANYTQIPINRPHAPVNDMFRDGFHQDGVHPGVAPYRPHSLDGGCPFLADAASGAVIEVPTAIPESRKHRGAPSASFGDHFSHATMFYRSLNPIERAHMAEAFAFELGRCYEQPIKERYLGVLANVDAELCSAVAASLGLEAPPPSQPPTDPMISPALSQVGQRWPVEGRNIGIMTAVDSDPGVVATMVAALAQAKQVPLVIAPHGGTVDHDGLPVSRTYLTGRSVEFDAIVVAGSPIDGRAQVMVEEAFRHLKPFGVLQEGSDLLARVGVSTDDEGVFADADPRRVVEMVIDGLAEHRVWNRAIVETRETAAARR